MLKPPGLPCPNCNGIFCAEYAQKDQPARWTCHNCGSTGEIAGDISIRPKPAATETAREPKPHWRTVPVAGAVPVRHIGCGGQIGWFVGGRGAVVARSTDFLRMDGSRPEHGGRVGEKCQTCGAMVESTLDMRRCFDEA